MHLSSSHREPKKFQNLDGICLYIYVYIDIVSWSNVVKWFYKSDKQIALQIMLLLNGTTNDVHVKCSIKRCLQPVRQNRTGTVHVSNCQKVTVPVLYLDFLVLFRVFTWLGWVRGWMKTNKWMNEYQYFMQKACICYINGKICSRQHEKWYKTAETNTKVNADTKLLCTLCFWDFEFL